MLQLALTLKEKAFLDKAIVRCPDSYRDERANKIFIKTKKEIFFTSGATHFLHAASHSHSALTLKEKALNDKASVRVSSEGKRKSVITSVITLFLFVAGISQQTDTARLERASVS